MKTDNGKISSMALIVAGITGTLIIAIILSVILKDSTPSTSDGNDHESWLLPEGTTSMSLINAATRDGRLDAETALLYKAYALFRDERLPSQYSSEVISFETEDVLGDIRRRLPSLSATTRQQLAPFLKRPDEPDSYFNQRFQQEQRASQEVSSAGFISKAQAIQRPGDQYQALYPASRTIVSADGKVKIWYPDATTEHEAEQYQQMANNVKTILDTDTILSRISALMNRAPLSDGTRGGDERVDLYLYMNMSDLGKVYPDQSQFPTSSFVLINTNLMSKATQLKTVLAHELFHVIQFTYKQSSLYDKWWREASATWSEDYIYPLEDTEQARLKVFIPYPGTSLDDTLDPDKHEYGAYLFPFYLTQRYNDALIRTIWEQCGAHAECLDAINSVVSGGLKERWKEFTLWNYNKDHVRKFVDDSGRFSTLSSVSSNRTKSFDIVKDEKTHAIGAIDSLAAQLIKADNTVSRSEVKKVVFEDLDKFTGKSDKASIKAVIYFKNKAPAVEDWTERQSRTLCLKCEGPYRDRCIEEDFSKIVLIFANADKTDGLDSADIKVTGEENACSAKWKGTLKVSEKMNLSGPFVGGWQQNWTVIIREELEVVKVGKRDNMNKLAALNDPTIDLEFHVMKQEIDYNYKETHRGGTFIGKGKATREHQHPNQRGILINDDTELATIVRFTKMKDYSDKGPQAVLGHGEYYFNDASNIYGDCRFVKYHDGKTRCPKYGPDYRVGGSFIGADGALRGYSVTPTENGTRFKGSDSFTDPILGRVTTHMEWDYRLVTE